MTAKDGEKFQAMRARLEDLLPRLNERERRLALAAEAKSWATVGSPPYITLPVCHGR